jgi:hypothetical protein
MQLIREFDVINVRAGDDLVRSGEVFSLQYAILDLLCRRYGKKEFP